ncbi:MAG: tetratricopeptide repeat protein [Gammaproteobacteria bacterium]|nr:tetratricopeptide repeat protein [Gammaproteobacteria bacterium]
MRVVPRGIAFAYKDSDLDLRSIATELGVRALVTGRISEIGDTLVISAELVDATRVEQLWGEQYNRNVADVLAVQQELVGAIIEQLALSLTPEELTQLTDPATQNPEAYRLYLKSKYHIFRVTADGLDKGVGYAQQAIELDPDFALAHVALSQAQMTRAYLGRIPWAEGGRISRAAAQRALALDDSLSEVHVELGFLAHHFDWDWLGAEAAFRRAVELDANNGDAWQGVSEALLSQARVSEAVAAATRAVELAPLEPNLAQYLGHALVHARRYEEALTAITQSLDIEPNHILARSGVPSVLLLLGRNDEAITAALELIEWSGGDPASSSLLAWIYSQTGNLDGARMILENPARDSTTRARALMATGQADAAFAILDRLFDSRSRGLLWFSTYPGNEVFRDDARYEGLIRRMGVAVQ